MVKGPRYGIVALGTGQAAVPLSERFKKVIATDSNQAQFNVAPKRENILISLLSSASKTSIPSQSIDLITIKRCIGFPSSVSHKEVKRVAKPKGLISAWCYGLGSNPGDSLHYYLII